MRWLFAGIALAAVLAAAWPAAAEEGPGPAPAGELAPYEVAVRSIHIDEMKTRLEKERLALMKLDEELTELGGMPMKTPKDAAQYNQKVKDLKERMAAFEKERARFNQEVADFNEMAGALETAAP